MIRLLAFTGARKSEITTLRWCEIDLERGYLRLGDSKTGAKIIPIGAPACEVLASIAAVAGSEFVFPASRGGGRFQGVERVWQKVRAIAGFPSLRLHDLRHSFAPVGLARGDVLPVIGTILGHVETTARYAHLADDHVKQAANAISKSVHAAFIGNPPKGSWFQKNREILGHTYSRRLPVPIFAIRAEEFRPRRPYRPQPAWSERLREVRHFLN